MKIVGNLGFSSCRSCINFLSFEVVVDKGTLDAVMCNTECEELAMKMSREVHRVLKQDGTWLLFSHSSERLSDIDAHEDEEEAEHLWTATMQTVKCTDDIIYFYVLKKFQR